MRASESLSGSHVRLRARRLVSGEATGRLLVVSHPVSFYGELEDADLSHNILVAPGSRGSTVAPYIMYRMQREGRAPRAILLVGRAEPMIIAGAVLSGIPLCDRLEASIGTIKGYEECVSHVIAPRGSRECYLLIYC